MSRFVALMESAAFKDTRKPKAYFTKYLTEQRQRIADKMVKLKDADAEKKQRILTSLIGQCIDLMKAEFSAGTSTADLKKILTSMLLVCGEYKKATYDDLVNLLSLAVVLHGNASKLIASNKQTISSDRLLDYLANATKGNAVWDNTLKLNPVYTALDTVFDSEQPEFALLSYLDGWYKAHSASSWYESHKRDTDTYCGYWSFEAAAVAKLLKLDESAIDSEYYPKF